MNESSGELSEISDQLSDITEIISDVGMDESDVDTEEDIQPKKCIQRYNFIDCAENRE
jgi:hypothetical protein